MATDVEESDTDDHERPASPKRQCTRLKVNETWDSEVAAEKVEAPQDPENVEYDDAERHAREKLQRWQECQVAKGLIDNTINKTLEDYFMGAPSSYLLEQSRFHLFRENYTEDTAVLMAIRNYGLIQSAALVSQSHAFYSDKAPGYWTNSDYVDVHCSCPANRSQSGENFSDPLATTSAVKGNSSRETGLDWDKVDDSDQQEDFLERAVAEAIKKKGLSALSVDYG